MDESKTFGSNHREKVRDFLWKSNIYHFGLPLAIVTATGKVFTGNYFDI